MTAIRTRCLLSIQPASDGGGSETALIGMIAQLVAEGWECHVAVPSAARLAEEYRAAGASVHVVGMHRITTTEGAGYWLRYLRDWPASVIRLALLARRVGAGVVHSNSLHSWYGWAVAPLVARPHVWHAREIVVQSRLALRVERVLARHAATTVVAMSAAIAAQLDPFNVVVVMDDPDPDVEPGAPAFRAAAGIGDDAPLVGSVARIDTWKGFDVLLDAVPSIQRRHPGVVVVVAGAAVGGKDDYAAALADRAATIGGIRWLGRAGTYRSSWRTSTSSSRSPPPPNHLASSTSRPWRAACPSSPETRGARSRSSPGPRTAPASSSARATPPRWRTPSRASCAPPPSRTVTRRARRPLRPSSAGRYAALLEPLRSGTIRPRRAGGTAPPSATRPPS